MQQGWESKTQSNRSEIRTWRKNLCVDLESYRNEQQPNDETSARTSEWKKKKKES
jgi:hypothetical protein